MDLRVAAASSHSLAPEHHRRRWHSPTLRSWLWFCVHAHKRETRLRGGTREGYATEELATQPEGSSEILTGPGRHLCENMERTNCTQTQQTPGKLRLCSSMWEESPTQTGIKTPKVLFKRAAQPLVKEPSLWTKFFKPDRLGKKYFHILLDLGPVRESKDLKPITDETLYSRFLFDKSSLLFWKINS